MKVLRVIASMNPSSGGPCQGIRNSIPEMEKLGVYNEVVCIDDPSAAFLGKDLFPIHALGAGHSPWNYSANLTPWLLENFHRFDVVIVHGLWLHHSYAVLRALRIYKKQKKNTPKLFIMPHGMLDPYFQKAPNRRFKALRNWIYWKVIEGKVVNNADGLLFTCESELQLARESFRPYHPKREINIGYGIVEPPIFNQKMHDAFQKKCPQLNGNSYLLFLSRIHEKKGVDLVIKAYAELIRKVSLIKTNLEDSYHVSVGKNGPNKFLMPEIPKLIIAGPGIDTPYGAYLQKLASVSEEVKNSIFFPGMLSGEAKWGAFYGCEAFVLPSHQENFGIAVVEALACGKPVLISNQVNIWREIEKTGAGLIANDTEEGAFELLAKWQNISITEKQELPNKAKSAFENYFAIRPNVKKMWKSISI